MEGFKKGNIIENLNSPHNLGYYTRGMKTAEVVYLNGYPCTMGIKILEHEDEELIGKGIEVECREEWFKVIK